MVKYIIKRDGRVVDYDISKIERAVAKAMNAIGEQELSEARRMAQLVELDLNENFNTESPSVEQIQDCVEKVLMKNGLEDVAKAYIIYRNKRNDVREMSFNLMKVYDEICCADSKDSDVKRENANIDSNTAMGTMLKFGSEGAKDYYCKFILPSHISKAHKDGDIHIHDLDFYTLTETCCQIDIEKLFKGGFGTGHGFIREPNDIRTYSALACIAIQANQNDQHGGQSIPNFDYGMALGVKKTFKKTYWTNFAKAYNLMVGKDLSSDEIKGIFKEIEKEGFVPTIGGDVGFDKKERSAFSKYIADDNLFEKIKKFAYDNALNETDDATYQGMESVVHNLNTMHSRAGAQVPFSSINFGTDTSKEGRMVSKNFLLAIESGMGNGETAIFPIAIFKVKEGVNYNPTDPNYDLFKLAMRVSSKRMFPNFSFIDAPYNLQYYKPGHPETEIAYMGCRTRVIGNTYDPTREIVYGRGNLSFTSINLPRLGIEAKGDLSKFYKLLDEKLDLCVEQLLDRFRWQCKKHIKNYPFLMGQGVWIDSDKLGPTDDITEILKHGTLSVGFIGLAETLIALTGNHHGESQKSWDLGYQIIKHMRDYMDDKSNEYKLNFSLLATPAEGLSGRFVRMDRKKYGVIPGITDKEYYTNSFHVPVYYTISAFRKIELEAPFHELTNAGHISYIELDGDTSANLDAFEAVVRKMKECGIGYGAINHPIDRDPVCGYNGIIGDVCPCCGRKETEGEYGFERIRRITGYLVGTLDRFNNAKKAEVRDRVKHTICPCDDE